MRGRGARKGVTNRMVERDFVVQTSLAKDPINARSSAPRLSRQGVVSTWEEAGGSTGHRCPAKTLKSRNSRRVAVQTRRRCALEIAVVGGSNPLKRPEPRGAGAEMVADRALAREVSVEVPGGEGSRMRGRLTGRVTPLPGDGQALKEATPWVLPGTSGGTPASAGEEQGVKGVETSKAQSAGVGIPARRSTGRRTLRPCASAVGEENPMRGGYASCAEVLRCCGVRARRGGSVRAESTSKTRRPARVMR
jgi:hypothetical protein